jgi:hypothetical protein
LLLLLSRRFQLLVSGKEARIKAIGPC